MVRLILPAAVSVLLALAPMSCGGEEGPDPAVDPSRSNSPSPSPDPSREPSAGTDSLADDFRDPSTGWDATGAARYRDGKLIVGDSAPAAMLVPSPLAFNGPRVVSAAASIEGPGRSVIGLFCAGNIDLSTAYVAFIDMPKAVATIGRLSSAGAEVMGRGKHIDKVVSLDEPLLLGLQCAQAQGVQLISLEIDGVQVARGVDPTPLRGPVGGLYFEYTRGGTVGIFDNFEMVPLPNG